jgi:hypothetical protein
MIDHAVKTSQQDLPLFGPVIFEIEKERKALISCFERVMALGLSRLVEIPFLSFGKPKEEE